MIWFLTYHQTYFLLGLGRKEKGIKSLANAIYTINLYIGKWTFSMVSVYRWCVLYYDPSMDKRNLIHFLKNLIDVTLILNLHMSQVKLVFHFLILKWAYLTVTFPLICISSPQIDTNFYITHHLILIILNAPLFTVRPWGLVGYALTNLTFLNILRVWNLGLK